MHGRGLNPFRVLLSGGILITGRCPVLDDPTLSGLGILCNERVIKTTSEFSIHKPHHRKISHAMIPGLLKRHEDKPHHRKISHAMIPGLLKRHEGHQFGLCPERASSLSTGRSPGLVNSYFHHALKGLHRVTSNTIHNIQFHTYLFVIRFGCLVPKMMWRLSIEWRINGE